MFIDWKTILIAISFTACNPTNMKVMTFNMASGAGSNYNNPDNWANQGKLFRFFNPDFACFQEVDFKTKRAQYRYNASELVFEDDQPNTIPRTSGLMYSGWPNKSLYFGPSMNFDEGKYGNAIFAKSPVYAKRFDIQQIDDYGMEEPRSILTVEFNTATVICAHLSVYGRDPQALRARQLIRIKALIQNCSGNVVLMGDFNTNPEEVKQYMPEQMKLISSNGIDQIWSNMIGYGGETDTQGTSDHDTFVWAEF